jgi:hypothetical protein
MAHPLEVEVSPGEGISDSSPRGGKGYAETRKFLIALFERVAGILRR